MNKITRSDSTLLFVAAVGYYKFNSENRFYHNTDHARRVVEALDVNDESDVATVIAATWHDAIYIPGSKVNEEASANALSYEWKRLNISASPEILAEAVRLIRNTTVEIHCRTHEFLSCNSNDGILLDADLLSLSDPYPKFLENQYNIIKENNGDPTNKEHKKQCSDFLQNLVIRPYIYCTERFRKEHEQAARENIKRFYDETR